MMMGPLSPSHPSPCRAPEFGGRSAEDRVLGGCSSDGEDCASSDCRQYNECRQYKNCGAFADCRAFDDCALSALCDGCVDCSERTGRDPLFEAPAPPFSALSFDPDPRC